MSSNVIDTPRTINYLGCMHERNLPLYGIVAMLMVGCFSDFSSEPEATAETSSDAATTDPHDETGVEVDTGGDTETSDDTGDTSTSGDDMDDAGEPPEDTTPPEVVLIDPPHGSTNIIDQPVRVVFSEIMDTASFEAAFPTVTDFEWSNSDSSVEFEFDFPFEASSTLYDLVVPSTVTDLAGNPLTHDVVATIGIAGLASATLEYDPSLTGNVCHTCSTLYTWFTAGDKTTNTLLFAGVSFPLAQLPGYGSTLGLRSAFVKTQVIGINGDPTGPDMGNFVLDHVSFASGSQLSSLETVIESGFHEWGGDDLNIGEPIDVDVTTQFEQTWMSGSAHFQLRVRATQGSANASADTMFFRRGGDENDSIVHPSLIEPDPSNRARVEVEYFIP